jgi:mRNA-degrading endonuclease toxin of MazEF toxin-antitoxin module
VSGGAIRRGDIVLTEFRHSNLEGVAVRPALVISNDEHNAVDIDVVCLMISSQVDKAREGDIVLTPEDAEFKASGLNRASVFRVPRIQALEKTLVVKRLGHVSEGFLAKIGKAITALLNL